jgi:hypothetical protein
MSWLPGPRGLTKRQHINLRWEMKRHGCRGGGLGADWPNSGDPELVFSNVLTVVKAAHGDIRLASNE